MFAEILGPLSLVWIALAARVGGYFVTAFVLWRVLWVGPRFEANRTSSRVLPPNQVRDEIRSSLATTAVYALGCFALGVLEANGKTRMYAEVADLGGAYFALSVIGLMVLYDTFFYWSHRAMHAPALFLLFHAAHHRFRRPTPWGTLAMPPLDAAVQMLAVIAFAAFIPLHPGALALWSLLTAVINVVGHAGYQFGAGDGLVNTSGDHEAHHAKSVVNYGFYLTVWDRICGTYEPFRKTSPKSKDIRHASCSKWVDEPARRCESPGSRTPVKDQYDG